MKEGTVTCIDEAILVATDIDGLDVGQLEVPLQIWEDEWSHKACSGHGQAS